VGGVPIIRVPHAVQVKSKIVMTLPRALRPGAIFANMGGVEATAK
jgi:hypothetical protein